ncbi:Uncharacterised protein [uncultured archaeon]|nr:Uncharacterised protein [uncultured archaeon]
MLAVMVVVVLIEDAVLLRNFCPHGRLGQGRDDANLSDIELQGRKLLDILTERLLCILLKADHVVAHCAQAPPLQHSQRL